MTAKDTGLAVEQFVEAMFRMMLDHHRSHVVETDLTVVQVETIALLAQAPLPATRLAASLAISGPALTQLTDRLARKGLIERRPFEGDRRTVMVALTDQGTRVVHRFRKRRSVVFAGALSQLSESEQEDVIEALNKFVVALEGPAMPNAKPGTSTSRKVNTQRSEERTAVVPPAASNEAEPRTATLPVRRMRIEWD